MRYKVEEHLAIVASLSGLSLESAKQQYGALAELNYSVLISQMSRDIASHLSKLGGDTKEIIKAIKNLPYSEIIALSESFKFDRVDHFIDLIESLQDV